jgi:CHAT domain-containing protein
VFALSDPRGREKSPDAQRSACAQLDALGALPGAQREVAAIHALLPGTGTWSELSGAAATEDALRARLPGNAVLHLATHALSLAADCLAGSRSAGFASRTPSKDADEKDASLGALIVAPGAGDGLLSESEIAALDLSRVRWAVLSACDTGLGASRSYEGAFGLRRAFALAGVRSVIMSLWRVDDAATADWMTALYRARWKDGVDTLDAVFAAQRATLRSRREAKQSDHPYYWAAFVAAGDWR